MTKPTTIWTHFSLQLDCINIAGGLPTDPRLVDAWQQAHWRKAAKLAPEDPQTPEEAAQRTLQLLEPRTTEEAGWTTFARDPAGFLAIEGRQIKAMLKESANICKQLLPVNGKVIPLRSKLAERVFVVERLIRIQPERTEPDAMVERAIHVMTAMGPRDALKRTDVCHAAGVHCTLRVLADGMFTAELLSAILSHGESNGLGADRSQGFGQFTASLTLTG